MEVRWLSSWIFFVVVPYCLAIIHNESPFRTTYTDTSFLGRRATVASLGRNDIVGDIAILIDIPRTATVTAKGELVTLKLTKELFFQLVNDFPEMAVEVMRVLATRLEQTTAQLREARAGNGAA